MKKIFGINIGSKDFGESFLKTAIDSGVGAQKIRAKHSCMVLRDGEVAWYEKGARISLADVSYSFFRVRGKYPLMTSLIANLIEKSGIPSNDSYNKDHTDANHKITQMLLLTLAKLPIPNTILCTFDGFASNKDVILAEISFPCVLKVNGSQGRSVWKVEDREDLERYVRDINSANEVFLLQEYIENSFDIRALYFDGDFLGAIARASADGGFLNNVSQGGTVRVIDVTDEEKEIVKKAAEVLKFDFVGADIVRTPRGPMLFELNVGPQVYGFESATGHDVAALLVSRILAKHVKGD